MNCEWLIKNWLPRNRATLLLGQIGAGRSPLLLYLAAVLRGLPLRRKPLSDWLVGRELGLDLDTGEIDLDPSLVWPILHQPSLTLDHKLTPLIIYRNETLEEVEQRMDPILATPEDKQYIHTYALSGPLWTHNTEPTEVYEQLAQHIEAHQSTVIILDVSLSSLTSVWEGVVPARSLIYPYLLDAFHHWDVYAHTKGRTVLLVEDTVYALGDLHKQISEGFLPSVWQLKKLGNQGAILTLVNARGATGDHIVPQKFKFTGGQFIPLAVR